MGIFSSLQKQDLSCGWTCSFGLGARKQPLLFTGANTSIKLCQWPGSAERISYSALHPELKHPRFTWQPCICCLVKILTRVESWANSRSCHMFLTPCCKSLPGSHHLHIPKWAPESEAGPRFHCSWFGTFTLSLWAQTDAAEGPWQLHCCSKCFLQRPGDTRRWQMMFH